MQQPTPFDANNQPVDNVENIDHVAKSIADELEGDDVPVLDNVSNFSEQPDLIDGTPDSFTSKTAADERAEAKIERPMQDKLTNTEDMEKLKRACADAISDLTQYDLDAKDINAEKQAIREKLEALGIGKKPLSMALAYSKMSPAQRDGFDTAYTILRDVIGEPIQSDLFASLLSGMPDDDDGQPEDPGAMGSV